MPNADKKSKSGIVIGIIWCVVFVAFVYGVVSFLKEYNRYKSIQEHAVEIVLSSTKEFDEIKDDHDWLLNRLYNTYSGADDESYSRLFGETYDKKTAYEMREKALRTLAKTLKTEGFELTYYEENIGTAEFFHYNSAIDYLLHDNGGQAACIFISITFIVLIALTICWIVIPKHKAKNKEVFSNVNGKLPRM